MSKLRVYTCKNFKGVNPVGVAAVVVAEDAIHAALLLEKELEERGLKQKVKPSQMKPVINVTPNCEILNDGDY